MPLTRRAALKLMGSLAATGSALPHRVHADSRRATVTPRAILEARRPQGGEVVWRYSDTGFASSVNPIVMSPDGRWFVSALVSGDVSADGDWLEIIAASTGSLEELSRVATIRRFFAPMLGAVSDPSSSHLTDPGRNPLRWLDSESITFLWNDNQRVRQVYRVEVPTGRTEQLTFSATHVEYFECHGADLLIYAARAATGDDIARERMQRGFVVDSRDAYSLARGWVDEAGALGRAWDCQWFLKRAGQAAIALDINGAGRDLCGVNNSLIARFAPDGRSILVTDTAPRVPDAWDQYSQGILGVAVRDYRTNGKRGLYARLLKQCFLLDIQSRQSRLAIDSPFIGLSNNGLSWSPSGESFLLGPVVIPGGGNGDHELLLEVNKETLRWSAVPVPAGLRTELTPGHRGFATLEWLSNEVIEVADDQEILYFRKRSGVWSETHEVRPRRAVPPKTRVRVRQGPNDPPVYVARRETDGREVVIFDPNPKLKEMTLAHVEPIEWKDSLGNPWSGLVYHPRGARGRRPLVIQSYVKAANDEFSLTGLGGSFPALGPGWSVFVAQALAARGMVVLQTGITRNYQPDTEGATFVDGIESAIRTLDQMEVIDVGRVGLSGWSRSGWHVQYALVHSDIVYASAIASDNVDGSYIQNTLLAGDFLRENHGQALGPNLKNWLEQAVGFNVGRIYTPLRLQSESRAGPELLAAWEVFDRLRQLGRPVEYYVVPDVEHGCHTLQNPRQILANQTGAVDWHDFWLGDHEADPGEGEQYARWRALRNQRDVTLQTPRPPLLQWSSRPRGRANG